MPASTARGAFPYPVGADNSKQIRVQLQALADRAAVVGGLFVQSTAALRPAVGAAGTFHYATDTGAITYDTGSAWVAVNTPTKTVRRGHAFTISGTLDTTTEVPGFFVSLPAGQTSKLRLARHQLAVGTATVLVKVNGTTQITVSATTSAANSSDPNLTLADGDYVTISVTAISAATVLRCTVFEDVTV